MTHSSAISCGTLDKPRHVSEPWIRGREEKAVPATAQRGRGDKRGHSGKCVAPCLSHGLSWELWLSSPCISTKAQVGTRITRGTTL